MKKIIAFAGSNSSTSINQILVSHIASTIKDCEVLVLHLTDYELPIYSEDLEKNAGFPEALKKLAALLKDADGLIISVNEHNGTVSAFFKNILDWLTRIDYGFVTGKKLLLLSTSPGKRGGQTALAYISGFLERIKGEIIASIPFPSFNENFSVKDHKIVDEEIATTVNNAVTKFVAEL